MSTLDLPIAMTCWTRDLADRMGDGRPGLGGGALAVGAGFLVARMAFPTNLWYIPYLLFWVWVLVVSTRMLRVRPATDAAAV